MKEKTKLKIIQKIAENLSLEDKFSPTQIISVWASYLLQIGLFQICLLVSIAEPQLHISDKLSQYDSVSMVFFITRMVLACLYIITKSSYIIPAIKLFQMTNIYLLRTGFCAIPLIVELLAQMYLTVRKEKRQINFDSRLQNKYFGTKIFAVYILLFATFLTPTEQIDKNPSAVFFTSLIYYVAACLDNVYSHRTKEILRNMALCPILMAIYFMFEPLVPALNAFGLATHSIVSVSILLVIVVYAFISEYSYHHDILYKKILNLESRDKLLYIWSLIYFCQFPTQNDLICFIKTHQSKCFNSLCPLNYSHNSMSKDGQVGSYSPESIQKAIKIYLKKALQRFASQSDQIRRLFIYFRKQDDPKIVHLLRQDDIYQKIEEYRISKNLERYNDPSLEYEQMKEIQDQTLTKVKLFLNHYDYFLSYINKESIKMQTSQEIIKELLKLKKYFLSFKPNALTNQNDKKNQTPNKDLRKNSQGYEKIQTQTIPVKKMTMKTVMLVNFMRKVYFNLPSLEKEEFSSKKLTYISQDFEQSPILIVSAESYNLGKIVNWNSMAQKILLYSTKQLRSKFVNDLVPKTMHKVHEKIFMKAALSIQLQEFRKQLAALVFCFTKASYAEVFDLKIQGTNSISGNKWVVQMKHHYDNQAVVICDQYRNIIGVNKNAINFGITLNSTGELMNQQLFNRLVDHKKDKVNISAEIQPIDGFKMDGQTQWELASVTPTFQDMPRYFIFVVQKSHEVQKMTFSRFTKRAGQTANVQENDPEPTNGFEFNFDPYLLKYTNESISEHQYADLKLIWQQNQSIDQNEYNDFQYQNSDQRKLKNYGENIHEMIYFDSKLEFKENYEQVTEFETHPNYLQNGKLNSQKNVVRLNINKDNFVDNVGKIKEKTPSYVYKLISVQVFIALVFLIALTIRFIQFNSLYSSAKQKQLVNQEIINRKNYIDNIGSLAVYNAYKTVYSSIWERYLTNQWTFEQLFVQIQYTNGKINNLNSDIGLLVNKYYIKNGTQKTLASYFESLSIQASAQSSGSLNLTLFISEIVDDMSDLEQKIQADVDAYYEKQHNSLRRSIYIIDSCNIAVCILCIIVTHFILRKAFNQRVFLFKSLSVIEEEQIYRIQKNLNDHREQIKNNELDTIQDDDYTEALDSQNIPHTKKMLYSYVKNRVIIFYVFFLIGLIVVGSLFIFSQNSYQNITKIQLVTPFINIVGEQRNSMAKMYLNLITKTKNTDQIYTEVTSNIRMFETNKKGVIDSLIAKEFSDSYMSFYNQIWFNPCDVLGVADQCSSLFSGILSDNLDYNYVYILTEIQKILDYQVQLTNASMTANPMFVKDATSEINNSFKKINFLLFDFMIKLQSTFATQTESQILYLYDVIEQSNLVQFLVGIIVCIVGISLILYNIYSIKDMPNQTLEMVTTVVPYSILMRNEYFVEWYKKKFKNVY